MADSNQETKQSKATVEGFMTTGVHTVDLGTTVKAAIQLLLEKHISGCPIVNSSQTVVSVVSALDLMKFAAMGGLDKNLQTFLDKLVKPEKLITIQRNQKFADAFKLFLTHKVGRVIVVDGNGRLLGLVTRSSMLKVFMENVAKGQVLEPEKTPAAPGADEEKLPK